MTKTQPQDAARTITVSVSEPKERRMGVTVGTVSQTGPTNRTVGERCRAAYEAAYLAARETMCESCAAEPAEYAALVTAMEVFGERVGLDLRSAPDHVVRAFKNRFIELNSSVTDSESALQAERDLATFLLSLPEVVIANNGR